MLPHEFPFRLVERREGETVVVCLTTNAAWLHGRESAPEVLAIEILAQAAILLFPETAGAGRGLLAGVDEASFHRPLAAGERLQARIEIAGRFGRLMKVRARLETAGEELVAEASLLLAQDG